MSPLLRGLLSGALTLLAAAGLAAALSAVERGTVAAAEPPPFRGHALHLDGRSALRFADTGPLQAPDGRFTLECWVRGEPPERPASVAGNRHYGGFGLTWAQPELGLDRPTGWVNVSHVPGTQRPGYLLLRPVQPSRWESWHHLALTYDGRLARLFVDGEPVAETVGMGRARPSARPFFVGADPDAHGDAEDPFVGDIDGLRVSRVVRYTRRFTPAPDPAPDEQTSLLLDFEDGDDPFADRSPRHARPEVVGAPRRVPVR